MKNYKALGYLDNSFHYKADVIKFSKHETFNHFLAKCLLCFELRENDKHFVTEAIFKNGKRADILVLDDEEAYEVLESETKEQCKEKEKSYPVCIRAFRAQDVIAQNMKQ